MIPFDELRAKYPHLGFTLYAYVPGEPVTLECLTREGKTFKFVGATAEDAMRAGFADDMAALSEPTVSASPTSSVFD